MSRTLGFIAGLTVPASLYYLSVVHLQGTTSYVSEALHQQRLRLDDPTKLEPIVLDPRLHDTFPARIRQGWNDGIENGVRFIQETDWQDVAAQTRTAASNLSRNAYGKMQPTIEEGQAKLHELSESSRDATLHAGEAVGTAIHDAKVKSQELAHASNVKAHELTHEAKVKAQEAYERADKERHRLAQVAREDAIEAKEILRQAEKDAEIQYELLKSKASKTSEHLKEETARQAHEAQSILSAAGTTVSSRLHDMKDTAAELLNQAKHSAKNATQETGAAVKQVEKKAEQSLLSAKMRASEEWILAEDKYNQLLTAAERKSDMKFKELEEEFGRRRLGFSRVDDPTSAAKQVQAAQRYNMKTTAAAKEPTTSAPRVAEILQVAS